MTRPPRVIFLVTEDWYFVSHRLSMARVARDAGFEVHVATHVDRHGAAIEAEGFKLHALPWRRGSLDPRDLVPLIRAIRRLYRGVMPNIAHHVSVEASAVGSCAAIGLPIACVNAITGLGTMFYGDSAKTRLARGPLMAALSVLLRRRQSTVLVQNPDDRAIIEPPGAVSVAFVGRLLESKGIRVLIAAHELLRSRSSNIRLLIAGVPDQANRDSVSNVEVASWTQHADVIHLGQVDDIRTVWAAAHIAALPSRVGEGMPLSKVEAAACGRALIATDMPGCREIVRHGINGLLVPRDDAATLADAIERLAKDAALRRRFGQASRELVEREYSSARVGRDLVNLYRRILPTHVLNPR